ncbi:MAG TPA: 6-phosphogluconolactonase [Actinomycetota bacterium]|nr:6-phosphogluconolactonase [Actinomycetota bacterium]
MIDRKLEVLPDADAVARRAAEVVAAAAREAIGARGRFTFAVSGGRTPWEMFRELSAEDVPWDRVGIWQVDERVAPDGDPDRNLTELASILPADADLCPMPVTDADLEAAAERYAASLPETFDLIHLGMGDDGHTASLVPGDPVLEVTDRDVALTGEYRGLRRMTFTYPVLGRARAVLWLITGEDKAPMLRRLLAGDPSIAAGRVAAASRLVVADAAAASGVDRPSRAR